MKNVTYIACFALCFALNSLRAQDEIKLNSRDSIITSSWMLGVGYNFVDDSGDVVDELFSVKTQWNTLAYPTRISIGRYFRSGLGFEAIGTYNTYKAGKIIDKVPNPTEKAYYGLDARLTYDLNKIIGQTAWFDPYIGVGAGFTEASNTSRATLNAVIGFRTWFSDHWGLDFSSSGKWAVGNPLATNHLQHAAGIVYQFAVEKELSKKGLEKIALLEALEKEKQKAEDSIAETKRLKEQQDLDARLAFQKKEAQLLAEKEQISSENKRKQEIMDQIAAFGNVLFDLNSSYLTTDAKGKLTALAVILKENPELQIKVKAHSDSRGTQDYNVWLSKRRSDRTIDYLTNLGIDTVRLKSEAYGEKQLLNECNDITYCPEEKHQVNRRCEFSIISF